MFVTNSITHDLIAVFIALLAVILVYFKWSLSYWRKKGLDGIEPSIPFGNARDIILGKKSFGVNWKDIYLQLKAKGLKHAGAYFCARPIYIPVDPELIKSVFQTDFDHFVGHGFYVNDEADPLSVNVLNLDGQRWKTIRSKLSPTFTSGKMKMMFDTLVECSHGLKNVLQDYSKIDSPMDVKDIMARFTTDVIVSCAFGIDSSSMKNPHSEFRIYGEKIILNDIQGTIKSLIQMVFPHSLLRFFNFKLNQPDVGDFFKRIVEQTIRYREENNVTRKDFMNLLIQLKNRGTLNNQADILDKETENRLTLKEIVAQSYIFFLGGFETSATTMTFTSYELALNPDIQDKARKEIKSVLEKHGNKLTYDAIMEMTYLEQVIHETLRKHPPAAFISRVCNKDYQIPGTDVIIDEGTFAVVPILGVHRDPEYYPDPEKYDPDRFSEENKAKRPQFTWIPFGGGPRICIGLRFAMMQTKIGLITMLKDFRISLNKKTKTPLVYSVRGIVLSSDEPILIDVERI